MIIWPGLTSDSAPSASPDRPTRLRPIPPPTLNRALLPLREDGGAHAHAHAHAHEYMYMCMCMLCMSCACCACACTCAHVVFVWRALRLRPPRVDCFFVIPYGFRLRRVSNKFSQHFSAKNTDMGHALNQARYTETRMYANLVVLASEATVYGIRRPHAPGPSMECCGDALLPFPGNAHLKSP